jgi:hypothetical protein
MDVIYNVPLRGREKEAPAHHRGANRSKSRIDAASLHATRLFSTRFSTGSVKIR